MHCTPLSSCPKIQHPIPTIYPENINITPPIPQSIPILSNASNLYPSKDPADIKKVLSLMAQPTDPEDYILEALKQLPEETLSFYRHPYYDSLLDATLTLIRPEALRFLLLKEPSLYYEHSLEILSEEQLANTLKVLADMWLKHYNSRGRRDWDRPAIGFPVIKRMTHLVASLYKAKVPEKPILDLFSEDFKTKEAIKGFLDILQNQAPYAIKAEVQAK